MLRTCVQDIQYEEIPMLRLGDNVLFKGIKENDFTYQGVRYEVICIFPFLGRTIARIKYEE